jgi:thiol-disulfide isomerase/thioredoxin
MKYSILFIFIFNLPLFGDNRFMQHLIDPWYVTEDIEKKRDIGNEIIRLMHENDYGKIAPDGIRDGDGGWSRMITLNIKQLSNIGKPFSLTVPTLDGKTFDTKDHLGKVVLIDFFATFCSPCKRVTKTITEVKDMYPDKISVLIIAPDRDIEKLKKYQSNLKYKFPTHFDPNGRNNKYKKEWGASLGHVYIVDQNGFLSDIHGHIKLAQKVERLLREE